MPLKTSWLLLLSHLHLQAAAVGPASPFVQHPYSTPPGATVNSAQIPSTMARASSR